MPIHDWTLVSANLFHDFHQTWSIAIRNALNNGLLPKGFSALVEQHTGGVVPDVLALERRPRTRRPAQPTGGGVITATPPSAEHVLQVQTRKLAGRGNRIVIRHALGEVVSIIEIVSPGNKNSQSTFQSFIKKSVDFIENGVHVLVIDLFPPGPRDPVGLHKAIWDQFEDEPWELPATKPLILAAFVADDPPRAYVQPVAVGESLPDMPAYLDCDSYVPVPLESTYQATWASCPEDMRNMVEHGSSDNNETSSFSPR